MLTIALTCLLPLAQDPVEPIAKAELTSALQEDGRRLWQHRGKPFTGAARDITEARWIFDTSFVDGYEHGRHLLRFADGRQAREVPMVNGREHGRVRMWREDGLPYVLEYNRNGTAVGPQLGWSATGKLEREEFFVEGKHVGLTILNIAAWRAEGTDKPEAHRLFWTAVVQARAGERSKALATLRASFEAGYPSPMDAIGLGVLAPLTDDPVTRPKLVQLWVDHARESRISMVRPDEPGTPFLLTIRVVDAKSGQPIPDVRLRVQHTDDTGYYFAEQTDWNVRLVGTTRPDADGRVFVRTILPGYYGKRYDEAGKEPRHIHFEVCADGYRDHGGEALFDNDPRVKPGTKSVPTIQVKSKSEHLVRGELLIRMRSK